MDNLDQAWVDDAESARPSTPLEAAAKELYGPMRGTWDLCEEQTRERFRADARAAVTAAIDALDVGTGATVCKTGWSSPSTFKARLKGMMGLT